jgi:hypothetical protein
MTYRGSEIAEIQITNSPVWMQVFCVSEHAEATVIGQALRLKRNDAPNLPMRLNAYWERLGNAGFSVVVAASPGPMSHAVHPT